MGRKGFTLIELIVVIAIIAILAAIIAPNAFKAVEKAKVSGTVGDWKSIKTGLMAYYSDMGTWPANCTGSACSSGGLFTGNTSLGWDGPYLDKWPSGKWSNGSVMWNSTTSGVIFNTTGAGERYITVTNVPAAQCAKIDLAIDGGTAASGTAGSGRYSGTTMQILLSRDGPVD
jgi:general secretion pathway protein G